MSGRAVRSGAVSAARFLLGLAAAALTSSVVAQGTAESHASAPDTATLRAAGEKAIRSVLLLPSSSRIAWPAGFKQGSWRPYNSRAVTGWLTCGFVYAKDKFGYQRERVFVTVARDDKTFADLDSQQGGPVERGCAKLRFPPSPTGMPDPVAPAR